jgi:hypothetical protein
MKIGYARVSAEGTMYAVDPELAGETVVLEQILFRGAISTQPTAELSGNPLIAVTDWNVFIIVPEDGLLEQQCASSQKV